MTEVLGDVTPQVMNGSDQRPCMPDPAHASPRERPLLRSGPLSLRLCRTFGGDSVSDSATI